MNLYPNYRPAGLSRDCEPVSIKCDGPSQAGDRLRRRGVPESWGNPTEAVGYFDDGGDGPLRAMVADDANGRRAQLLLTAGRWTLNMSNPEGVA